MVFVDVGKEYRQKVNNFNSASFYSPEQARIQQKEQERTETRSKGGLDETAQATSYWAINNPHRSVLGDQSFLNGPHLWNTKFQEKEMNLIPHKQPPSYGYNANYWTEHLQEIERNRVPNVIPAMVGNGKMVLVVDENV